MITPQYDHGHTLSAQRPPMLDTSLQAPNSGARISFSQHYSIQSRSHIDFQPHSPLGTRMAAGLPSMEFRYSPSCERRLPVHDQSFAHPMQNSSTTSTHDHRPSITTHPESMSSTSTASASSKPARKEILNVVIACRQW
jgi:hypothetical protein